MKYFTRTITITGSLTIGVVAENIDDARKIFDSICEDEDYSLLDIDVDTQTWEKGNDEEVERDVYRFSNCCVSEKESKEILDYLKEQEDEDD